MAVRVIIIEDIIFQMDNSGNIWTINSDFIGVSRINPYNFTIDFFDPLFPHRGTSSQKVKSNPSLQEGLVTNLLSDDRGNTWMSGSKRLFKYSAEKDSAYQVLYDSTLNILNIICDGDKDNLIMIAGNHFRKLTFFLFNKNTLTLDSLKMKGRGRLYRGQGSYVWRLSELQGIIQHYLDTTYASNKILYEWNADLPLDYKNIYYIWESYNKDVWVIDQVSGIFLFQKGQNDFIQISHDSNNKFSLINNAVNHIFVDKGKNYWLATSQGLSILNNQQYSFKHISSVHFFNNITQHSTGVPLTVSLDDNTLLLATDNGLNFFDKKSDKVSRMLSRYSALKSLQIQDNGIVDFYRESSGKIWICMYDYPSRSYKTYRYNYENNIIQISNDYLKNR